MQTKITKWYTVNEYVDTETGEILLAKTVQEDYTITKKIKENAQIDQKMGTAIIRYLNECKRKKAKQGSIF